MPCYCIPKSSITVCEPNQLASTIQLLITQDPKDHWLIRFIPS